MRLIYTLDTLWETFSQTDFSGVTYLYGDLWSGKTTLSQFIARQLWVTQEVTSPTYVYYNCYELLYHFDLYRAKSYDVFVNIWAEEIFDTTNKHIIVEWPELIHEKFLPDRSIDIRILEDGSREAFIYTHTIPPRFL